MTSPGFYSRLFRYSATPALSPLENFLTEAAAYLLNRLPAEANGRFVKDVLLAESIGSSEMKDDLVRAIVTAKAREWTTQRTILSDGRHQFLDFALSLNGRPFIVIESKVGSGASREQLIVYDRWLAEQNPSGALVFLTHTTEPPIEFMGPELYKINLRSVCRWYDVYRWLKMIVDNPATIDPVASFLSDQLRVFLREKEMAFDDPGALDIAAALIYYSIADGKLRNSFTQFRNLVQKTLPKAGGFSDLEFKAADEGRKLWGFCYPDREGVSKSWYIAWGILFPENGNYTELFVDPVQEVLAFFVVSSDYDDLPLWSVPAAQRPSDWKWPEQKLAKLPYAIVTQPLANFYSHSAGFTEAFKLWLKPRLDEATLIVQMVKVLLAPSAQP
jgi:hypothetical protein